MNLLETGKTYSRGKKCLIIVLCFFVGILLNGFLFPLLDADNSMNVKKIATMLSTILTFAVPTILVSLFLCNDTKLYSYIGFRKAATGYLKPLFYLLVVVFMLSLLPFNEFISTVNANYSFPDFFKPLEDYFREQERLSLESTGMMLEANNFAECLLNLLVIALTPAVCEEMFFRGLLQNKFISLCKSPIGGILACAFFFSAMHFQFSGLIPRFILGFALGCLYYKTKSLWPSILAHFANNGTVVIASYVFDLQVQPSTDISVYASGVWLAAIFTSLLIAGVCTYYIFFAKMK